MKTNIDKNAIKCAVFDLDGTLLNTIKTINYYLNFALNKNGLAAVSEDSCMAFVGDGAKKLIERALSEVGADVEEYFDSVFRDYNAAYDADPYYLTEIYPGVSELLDKLRHRGIKIAVLSNKPNFATRAAVSHFFGDSFSFVAGGREGVKLKPEPDALLSILHYLEVTQSETVYIGDSETDVLTAKNAEVARSIIVTYGFRTREQLTLAGAEILVDSPEQIPHLI